MANYVPSSGIQLMSMIMTARILSRRLPKDRILLSVNKAEQKLRETSEYLNNLLNYANAPIIVWDSQFRITRFNHAFERLTGISADGSHRETTGYSIPCRQQS